MGVGAQVIVNILAAFSAISREVDKKWRHEDSMVTQMEF